MGVNFSSEDLMEREACYKSAFLCFSKSGYDAQGYEETNGPGKFLPWMGGFDGGRVQLAVEQHFHM